MKELEFRKLLNYRTKVPDGFKAICCSYKGEDLSTMKLFLNAKGTLDYWMSLEVYIPVDVIQDFETDLEAYDYLERKVLVFTNQEIKLEGK